MTIVTMCMGRLAQIQQTLPLNVATGCPVVFVDWSCPECSGDWVSKTFPSVKVVRAVGEVYFSMCKPRNLGLAEVSTPYVLFLDGDVFVRPTAISWMGRNIRSKGTWGLLYGGSLIAQVELFRAIGAWDEVFQGWGGEDSELWNRLDRAARRIQIPSVTWRRIDHSNAERVIYFKDKVLCRTEFMNYQYRDILAACRQAGISLNFEQRSKLYDDIRRRWGAP